MTIQAPDETFYELGPAAPVSGTERALNRIATALEQLVLERTAAPRSAPTLAALPPVQTVRPQGPGGVCPIHNSPWKFVPAGTAKATGKPYDAFWACETRGCDQRPPR